MFQVMPPEYFGDFRHTHRHAGMSGIRLLHRIHRKRANRVGECGTGTHELILAKTGRAEA
jgi:hypothetical protein